MCNEQTETHAALAAWRQTIPFVSWRWSKLKVVGLFEFKRIPIFSVIKRIAHRQRSRGGRRDMNYGRRFWLHETRARRWPPHIFNWQYAMSQIVTSAIRGDCAMTSTQVSEQTSTIDAECTTSVTECDTTITA